MGSAETENWLEECFRTKSKAVAGLVFVQQYGLSVWDVFFLARREAETPWLTTGVSSQGPQQSSREHRATLSADPLPSEEIL